MRRAITGVVLLDKPWGVSSNHALQRVRRLFGALKAGHTGTLDPHATGLLPLCLGEATKYSGWILEAPKSYHAVLRLGMTSSTGDGEGELKVGKPFQGTRDNLEEILRQFLGPQTQVPPMHSALKVAGKALYLHARAGQDIERQPRFIEISTLKLTSWEEQQLEIHVTVSKGTYIRVLAQDIGAALGCGAYLAGLRRTGTGPFVLAQAVTLEQLESMTLEQREQRLQPLDTLLAGVPRLDLDSTAARALIQGREIPWVGAMTGDLLRVYGNGTFHGLVRFDVATAHLVPVRMMGENRIGLPMMESLPL
ncbi:MAG: tRNA pseudouridine(55) synthase TruB [Ferrovum sp.]|nr:tRNA pseudouridine(55) synthase TruB [Ferrovum sp.]NDU87776.1 tRNA pseudouridine(55) synthase TruB [Ferrovum sp.]NDU91756.1 tRNA pseudouridine(55) synthase TruB [Ferrovum sp.]